MKKKYFKLTLSMCILVYCKLSYAAGKMQERLSPEVLTGLHANLLNPIRPHLIFENKQIATLWLQNMSNRLKRWVPDERLRFKYLTIIQYEAARAGLDWQLILSVITIEGRFNRFAVGTSGEKGMMQIMPFWVEQIGDKTQDLFDVQTNVRYGCTILRYYLEVENGDVVRALARYNGALRIKNYAGYPDRVLNAYNMYWTPNKSNTRNKMLYRNYAYNQ